MSKSKKTGKWSKERKSAWMEKRYPGKVAKTNVSISPEAIPAPSIDVPAANSNIPDVPAVPQVENNS